MHAASSEQNNTGVYTGRFAPTPSGPLHLGSLVTALASFLDARASGGHWLVRIDNLDPPREAAGAAHNILHTLQKHALHWDGELLYQGTRTAAYEAALMQLRADGLLFPCTCSRKSLQGSTIYPGSCRRRKKPPAGEFAWRVRARGVLDFSDRIQGPQHWNLERDVGDFIVQRRDGLFAYQLATTVDDAHQGITRVLRGADLLDSTAAQIYLQRCLKLPTPCYAHGPLVRDPRGEKLSKSTQLHSLERNPPAQNLRRGLRLLGQPAPPAAFKRVDALLRWAIEHWEFTQIPGAQELK